MHSFDMYDQKRKEDGFTLVELLVVILIIGILAAVAIPAFLGQRQRANDAAVESDAKNLATQIESLTIGAPNAEALYIDSYEADGSPIAMAFIGAAPVTPSRSYAEIVLVAGGTQVATQQVSLTNGVRVTAADTDLSDGYTFTATHDNGKDFNFDSDAWLLYDSNNGGIQKDAVSRGGSAAPGDDEGESGGDGSGLENLTAQEQGYIAEAQAWLQALQNAYPEAVTSVQLDDFGTLIVNYVQESPAEFGLPSLSSGINGVSWYGGSVQVKYMDGDYNSWTITSDGAKF